MQNLLNISSILVRKSGSVLQHTFQSSLYSYSYLIYEKNIRYYMSLQNIHVHEKFIVACILGGPEGDVLKLHSKLIKMTLKKAKFKGEEKLKYFNAYNPNPYMLQMI